MQKKILLPTDFSDNAWNAIIYALKLYTNEWCTFYLLHTTKIKISALSNYSNNFLVSAYEKGQKDLIALKQLVEQVNANANHSFEIISGTADLATAMRDSIERHQIQLIIMGTKGASGAKELFFGSNTVNIITKIKLCPVLVIPEQTEFTAPKKIAFATDFNRFYTKKELVPLQEITALYNAEINIIHLNNKEQLNQVQEYNSETLSSYLANYQHHFICIPNYTSKTVDLNTFIKKHNINILVMVNYKHSFIEKITKEPVIKKIGFQPILPFLVIPK